MAHIITRPNADQGDNTEIHLVGTGYATRCASAIVSENIPDALWALEVLNKYGHLVQHPADRAQGQSKISTERAEATDYYVPLAA